MTKAFSFLMLLHFFSFAFLSLHAQNQTLPGEIRGKIFDAQQAPLPFATINLYLAKDTSLVKGSISNEKGEFVLASLPVGSYLIAVGDFTVQRAYKGPYQIDSLHTILVIDPISYSPKTQQLNTVQITAKKPLIERRNDKIILNIANSSLAAGNSVLEIISKAPGVTVDNEGNISLKGKSGVSVMIDNKLTYLSATQLTSLLRTTNGNSVQTIEIISNPSAKYDATGTGGIINIKLKKKSDFGTNGSINAGAGYGNFYKSDIGISLNHRTKDINVFGNYNYTNNKELEDLNVTRSNTLDNEKTYFDQQGIQNYFIKNNSYKAGIDYYLNDQNIIGFMTSGYHNSTVSSDKINTLIGHSPFQIDSIVRAENPGNSQYKNQTYNLNYRSVIDTMGQELNIDVDYSKTHNSELTTYKNYFFNPAGSTYKAPLIFRNFAPTKVKIIAGKIDYTYAFNDKTKLETGIKSSNVTTDNDFRSETSSTNEWVNDEAKTNRFIYKEQVNAAYANLHKTFSNTAIQLGLRTELTHTEGNSTTLQNVVKSNYIDFFPSLSINQNLSDKYELTFSYSRRIERPDYESLNPFIRYADLYTLAQGNPSLSPQYANSFDLSFGLNKSTNITLGYIHTRNVMTTTLLTDSIHKTLLLFDQNLASRKTMSFNINRSLSITKWWSADNDATVYYSQFSTPNLMGFAFKNGKTTFIFNSNHNFIIDPSLTADLSVNYTSSQVYGTYIAKPIYGIDLGLSKSFADKKANIKLALNDVFNQRITKIKSAIPFQDYQLSQKQESRIFRLSFTYNFGSKGVKAARERSNSSATEQNRLKSGN